jgi:hypothetical protein
MACRSRTSRSPTGASSTAHTPACPTTRSPWRRLGPSIARGPAKG